MSDDLIREELKRTGYNISKVARSLGLDYDRLKADHAPRYEPIVRPRGPAPTDISTLGKVGMQKYVVAIKANGDGEWPMRYFNAIEQARAAYDAGTHEMCQHKRRDGWIVLYLVPRKYKDKPRAYFNTREFPWGLSK